MNVHMTKTDLTVSTQKVRHSQGIAIAFWLKRSFLMIVVVLISP